MIEYIKKTPIDEGWSKDKKYCLVASDGTKMFMRLSSVDSYERKKSEYIAMQKVAQLGVPMCIPIDFGISDEGVYSLQSWIDGTNAEKIMPQLSAEEQYRFGTDAGRILNKIHSLPAPEGHESWDSFFNRKLDYKICAYNNCSLRYENGELFIKFIEANRYLLKDRPQSYQHGDYHIGNMMIGKDSRLYIVDFDRNDYGDPWEEFNRIVWCAQSSPLFASGMINGYFNNAVPLPFWKLLALYISSNTLSSLPWAIPFGKAKMQTMIDQAKDVLSWYNNMENVIPSWYIN